MCGQYHSAGNRYHVPLFPIQELLQTDTPPEVVQQRKPSRKVLERLERIESLSRRKQDAILMTIDHFLNSAAG